MGSRRSPLVLALPFAAMGALFAAVSCGDGSHVYGARTLDRTHGCVGPMVTLDVVTGDDPGMDCAIKCLVSTSATDGDTPVYVSQECPPYPPNFDTSGLQSGCDEAIAAAERNDICLADGGSTNPGTQDASVQDANNDGS
ncbi:MAG TPA: hypothetical protein VNO21_10545 [Polyangiaceae bacterium]|nr:hypothetical protein [Polyangiaceae bacterium]